MAYSNVVDDPGKPRVLGSLLKISTSHMPSEFTTCQPGFNQALPLQGNLGFSLHKVGRNIITTLVEDVRMVGSIIFRRFMIVWIGIIAIHSGHHWQIILHEVIWPPAKSFKRQRTIRQYPHLSSVASTLPLQTELPTSNSEASSTMSLFEVSISIRQARYGSSPKTISNSALANHSATHLWAPQP